MDVVQQDDLTALKVHKAERIADPFREIRAGREGGYPDFLQVARPITSRASRMTGGIEILWHCTP